MTTPEISQLSVLVVDESQETRQNLAAFLSELSQLRVASGFGRVAHEHVEGRALLR